MKIEIAIKHIQNELRELDVPPTSLAYSQVFENALHASEILTKRELTRLIEDSLDVLPLEYWRE